MWLPVFSDRVKVCLIIIFRYRWAAQQKSALTQTCIHDVSTLISKLISADPCVEMVVHRCLH